MGGERRRQWLNVERTERREVALLVLVFFLLAFGYVVGQAAGYALFVKRFGARELPFAILCMPVVGVVLTWSNLRTVARWGVARALLANVAAMGLVSLLIRVAIAGSGHSWVRFALPMWDAGVNNLNNLVVWGAASRLFNVRQAKRIGPVVAAGRSTALVVGGLLVPTVVGSVGTTNLYVLQAAMFGGALAVLALLTRHRRDALSAGTTSGPALTTVPAEEQQATTRYTRAVFGVVFTSMMAYVLVRNIFLDRGAARYPEPADYAAQIGMLNAAQGLLTLFTALVLSGRFLKRFGLRGGLAALPVTLLLVYVPLSALDLEVGPQFLVAAGGFVLCGAIMFSIRTPAIQLLYQPLDAVSRTRAVSTAEGVVEPLALGAAAVVLLVVARAADLGARGMAAAVVVAGVVLAVLGRRAFGGYRVALERALARRWLRGGAVDLTDAATRTWLAHDVSIDDADQSLALVGLLEESGADATPLLVRMIRSEDAEARAFALERLLERDAAVDLDVVHEMAHAHPSSAVRAAAVRLVARAGRVEAAQQASTDVDAHVRSAALAGLLESVVPAARASGAAAIESYVCGASAVDRLAAARALALTTAAVDARHVATLVRDAHGPTRRAAYRAVARGRVPIERSVLVGALEDPATSEVAADALVALGDEGVDALAGALGSRLAPNVAARIVRAIGRVGTPQAGARLAALLDHHDHVVRAAAAAAMRVHGFMLSDHELARVTAREVEVATRAGATAAAIGARESTDHGTDLLRTSLGEIVGRCRAQVLCVLALRAEGAVIDGVERAWRDNDVARRAYALEALETSLPQPLREIVLPLLFEHDVRAVPDLETELASLAAGDDPWIAQLARRVLEPATTDLSGEGASTMIPLIERVVFLKRVGPFAQLPAETLAEVARVLNEVPLEPGEVLFDKGEPGRSMYFVFSGEVLIHDDGFELDRRRRGDVLGELAVFDAEPRTAAAVAAEDSLLLRLDQEPLYELMGDHPDVLRGFVSNVVGTLRARLIDIGDLRRELAGRSAPGR